MAGGQSSISRSEVTESVEDGEEAEGTEENGGLGDDGLTRREAVEEEVAGVVGKEGARVVEGVGELEKGDYVRKSREKGPSEKWSRNHSPRWPQRQTRRAHSPEY